MTGVGEGVEQPECPVLLAGMKMGTPALGRGPEAFTERKRGRAGTRSSTWAPALQRRSP